MDNRIIGEEILKFLQKGIPEQDEDQMIHTTLSMTEQKEVLGSALDTWMGNQEQVDDIFVMGVKIE